MEFFEIARIAEMAFFNDVYKRYLWAYLVIAGAVFAILYVLQSAALYAIAKREGFKNSWMAFVPFANTFYIGVLSEKNRPNARYIALGAAAVELVYAVLGILYYLAMSLVFKGGYAQPKYDDTMITMSGSIQILSGYTATDLPQNLNWAWWVFCNIQEYVMYWVQLAYIVLMVFVLVAFFRTYSSPRYILFSLFSVIFPIKAVFMFVVRNNKGKNYVEYLKEQQQRQYRMYQEYMRNSGMNGNSMNGYGNGQGGVNYGGYNGDPYAQQPRSNPPEDPFGGLGAQNGQQNNHGQNNGGYSGDPFDDLKN